MEGLMTFETKAGVAVSCSFLCLVGAVVTSKLWESKTAHAGTESEGGALVAPKIEKGNGEGLVEQKTPDAKTVPGPSTAPQIVAAPNQNKETPAPFANTLTPSKEDSTQPNAPVAGSNPDMSKAVVDNGKKEEEKKNLFPKESATTNAATATGQPPADKATPNDFQSMANALQQKNPDVAPKDAQKLTPTVPELTTPDSNKQAAAGKEETKPAENVPDAVIPNLKKQVAAAGIQNGSVTGVAQGSEAGKSSDLFGQKQTGTDAGSDKNAPAGLTAAVAGQTGAKDTKNDAPVWTNDPTTKSPEDANKALPRNSPTQPPGIAGFGDKSANDSQRPPAGTTEPAPREKVGQTTGQPAVIMVPTEAPANTQIAQVKNSESQPAYEAPQRTPAQSSTAQGLPLRAAEPSGRVESYDQFTPACKAGDTYVTISLKYYHSDKYAKALMLFNRDHPANQNQTFDPETLKPGQTVFVPVDAAVLDRKYGTVIFDQPAPSIGAATGQPAAAARAAAPLTAQPAPAPSTLPEKAYRVRGQNEMFLTIARATLGDENRWPEIYRLNTIYDPKDPIPSGKVLRMPGDARVDSADAAGP
jgi:hypothetical protein